MQPRKKGRRGARKKAQAAKPPAPLPAGTSAERSARHLRHLARNQKRAAAEPMPTYTCAGVHEDLRKADKIPPPPTDAQRVLLPTLSAHGNFMRALAPVLAKTHSALKGRRRSKLWVLCGPRCRRRSSRGGRGVPENDVQAGVWACVYPSDGLSCLLNTSKTQRHGACSG
jgi:hypothetical protein